jgi:MtrB/PioB family decaheme-associated outer membrane protein
MSEAEIEIMKSNQGNFAIRASVIAVHGAIVAMALMPIGAQAEDVTAADLNQPTNTVEVGVDVTSDKSDKFGEYNGLSKKGGSVIGNIDLRGGGAYDSANPLRWSVKGTDLGLETRSINAEFGEQGKFKINFGLDELLRERSDTYKTPYLGAGSNYFALPSNWIKPVVPQTNATQTSTSQNFRALDPTNGTANGLTNGAVVITSAGSLATLAAIRNADVPDFQAVDLHTKRTRYDGGFGITFNPQWDMKTSFKHETKVGYKPLSVVTSQIAEYAATLPDPIDQVTDQYNLALNYKGDNDFVTFQYYGSLFTDNVSSVTWQDTSISATAQNATATYATPPSNQFHQFGVTGGYNFTQTTKLVVDASYARNTQDEPFVTAGQNGQLPLGVSTPSLDGLVITKAFNLKLTSRPVKDLSLAAGYKYDNRDNQTPINTYYFHDANEAASTTSFAFGPLGGLTAAQLGSNLNVYNNRAYSKKLNQLNLDADYVVAKGHAIKVGYEGQKIDRGCGTWYNCADAPTTKENTLKAEWRGTLSDVLNAKLGGEYGKRTVNYDENAFLAFVPYANVVPTTGAGAGATMSAYQYMLANGYTGFGPVLGYPAVALTGNAAIFSPSNGVIPQALYGSRNNVNELIGMRRFNMADRNRDRLRAGANWQATDQLSLQAGYDYMKDDYNNSLYGLKDSKAGVFNLDGSYAASEDFTVTAFYTFEDRRSSTAGDAYGSNNNGTGANSYVGNAANVNVSPVVCYGTVAAKNQNAKIDPCLNWSTDMRDKVDTLGLTLKKKGLMSGKLELTGDLVYTRARTDINVTGGSYVNNPLAAAGAQPGGVGAFYIAASALPTVETNTTELRVNGRYELDKKSAVHVGYLYSHMKAKDWAYDGMQFGTGTNYMPTAEQAPDYSVSVVSASYIYSFK